MREYVIPIGVLTLFSSPIFFYIRRFFFYSWQEFFESIYFWMKPDLWSWVNDELREDWWAEVKLFFYVLTCVAIVAAEFVLLLPLIVRAAS